MRRRARVLLECLVVSVLVVASVWYGRFAFEKAAHAPDYYYISPAVAIATGQGFANPVVVPGSPLAGFLSGQRPAISRAEATVEVGPPEQFHLSTRYLILAVGYWWRVVGISWSAAADVAGALHALLVVGAYVLLRLYVPLPVAALGALWMCTSTLQLSLVPHLRDYSKGAFIVASLPLIVLLALGGRTTRSLRWTAAGAGALIGLGLGFKMDVAILAPFAVAAVVVFRGRRPWTQLTEKAQAMAVFGATLLVVSGPVLVSLGSGGSNSIHVVLLGYGDAFASPLGLAPTPYSFLPFYRDGAVANWVQAHYDPLATSWLAYPSAAYDRAGLALFLDIIRNFPADIYARGLGAANAVLNLAFASPAPMFLTEPLPAQGALASMAGWLQRFYGTGAWFGLGMIAVASWGNVRRGVLAAGLLLALAAYPSLQFESRHYFHTQVIPVVAIVFVLAGLVRGLMGLLGGARASAEGAPEPPGTWRADARAMLVGVGIAAAMVVAPLVILRAYQTPHLETVFDRYLSRPATPVDTTFEPTDAGAFVGPVAATPPPPEAPFAQGYVVEFADDGRSEPIDVGIRYETPVAEWDYSRVLSLYPSRGVNRVAFTAINVPGQSYFAGLELGARARGLLRGFSRVGQVGPAGIPLDLRLRGDWESAPVYQKLAFETGDDPGPLGRRVDCSTGPGCKGLLGYVEEMARAGLAPTDAAVHVIYSPDTALAGGLIRMSGQVESETSYLFQLEPVAIATRGALVARGVLDRGGLAIGLLKDGVWYRQIIVRTPGEFAVVVPVDEPGTFTPLVTNAVPPGQGFNQFTISRIGIIPAP